MSITNSQVRPPTRRHKPRPSRRKIQSVDALRYAHALVVEQLVIEVTGLSSASITRGIHAGEFPPPRKFGHFKRWVAGEITDWLKARAEGRQWSADSADHHDPVSEEKAAAGKQKARGRK